LAKRHKKPPSLWHAGYWCIDRKGGFQPWSTAREQDDDSRSDTAWEEEKSKLARRLVALARAAQRGEFPMASSDADCTGNCPFHTVCRVHQARSVGKQWGIEPAKPPE
jgi:hypothetical protein